MCIPEELLPSDLLSYDEEKEDNQNTGTSEVNSYNPPDNYNADFSDPFYHDDPLDT